MIAREELPNDTVELKGLVCQLLDVVEEQKKLIANLNERVEIQVQKIEEQSQRIDQLTDQVNSLKRYRFGKKSEKVKQEKIEADNQQETSPDANLQAQVHVPTMMSVKPEGVPQRTTSSGGAPLVGGCIGYYCPPPKK
jgi:septal ring factor EnvC (AmiA/AmiB activator)